MNCYLCPNNCGIDRKNKLGACHVGDDMLVCRIAPHHYEEPCISGNNGSGTVFFSGCSMDCSFCQNHEISKGAVGKKYTPRELADELKKLVDTGVHNINFVTPTHYSDKIIQTLDIYRPPVPIVYNTSGYERVEIIKKMHDYVDIYLTDVKYSDNAKAKRYSARSNYVDYCISATDEMVREKTTVIEDGLMKQGVIVRHLYLPGERKNTEGVIDLFADRWKGKAIFSFMSQFFPAYDSPIKRTLKPVEYKLAVNYILSKGIEDCYVQELSSADSFFVPKWEI